MAETEHTMRIYRALRRTSEKAAKAYKDFAFVRDRINSQLVHTQSAPVTYEQAVELPKDGSDETSSR